jgi:hypothetical protein
MVLPWQLQHMFVEELINFEILIQQKENIVEHSIFSFIGISFVEKHFEYNPPPPRLHSP